MMQDLRPTLLIGVGGTGSLLAERVFHRTMAETGEDIGQLAVIGFDTDDRDVRRRQHLSNRQKRRFSSKFPIYKILEDNPELSENWFLRQNQLTHEILNMSLIDGGGQIRIFSRLALHVAFKEGQIASDLRREMAKLATFSNQNVFGGILNVFILGSLAGATGCGSFLQIALAARRIALDNGVRSVQVRGFFLLPDIFVRCAGLSRDQQQNVLANATAALRELNAIMLATAGRSPLDSLRFEYMPGAQLESGGMPFDTVTLIDFENESGQNLGPNLAHYLDLAERAAFIQLFTPIGQEFVQRSVNSVLGRLEGAARGKTNSYSSIGVYTIEYPEADMLDYLADRMAADGLESGWLLLDRMYAKSLEVYEERRKAGDRSAPYPRRDQSFITNLEQLANDRRQPFRDIYLNVHREEENEDGDTTIVVQHQKFLSAFENYVKSVFRRYNSGIEAVYQRQFMSSSQLMERESLADDVRRREQYLSRDFSTLEDAIRHCPEDIYEALVAMADTMAPEDWQDHHLQAYLVRPAPHLLEVRYFLYSLQLAIEERLSKLTPSSLRKTYDDLDSAFDRRAGRGGSQRSRQVVREIAEELANIGAGGRLLSALGMKSDLAKFAKKYSINFNAKVERMRAYAEATVVTRALEMLQRDIAELLKLLELLFADLEGLREVLDKRIERHLNAHAHEKGAARAIRFAYASAEAKEALWAALRPTAASVKESRAANAVLINAYFEEMTRRRQQRSAVTGSASEEFSARALFEREIINGFSRDTIANECGEMFRMNVIDALKKDAALTDVNWQDHVQSVVSMTSEQAKPFINLADAQTGSRLIYWALSENSRRAIGDGPFYDQLFRYEAEESALVEPQFADQQLYCVNVHFNFSLDQLAKLFSGTGMSPNIHSPGQGSYEKAYRSRINELIQWSARNPNEICPTLTPHLDRDWHKPGTLPEIIAGVQTSTDQSIFRGLVRGLSMQWLQREDEASRSIFAFYDPTRKAQGVNRSVIGSGAEAGDLYLALRDQPHIIFSINQGWDDLVASIPRQEIGKEAGFQGSMLVSGLLSVPVLTQLLAISRNRSLGDVDQITAAAVTAYFAVLRNLIDHYRTDLSSIGKRDLFDRLARGISEQAITDMEAQQSLNEDVLSLVRNIPGNIIEHILETWDRG